ncbi:hypothetical protein V6N13_108466 [Hibiscus sabdariffa]
MEELGKRLGFHNERLWIEKVQQKVIGDFGEIERNDLLATDEGSDVVQQTQASGLTKANGSLVFKEFGPDEGSPIEGA